MDKTYNPKDFEKRIYQQWLQSNAFASTPDDARPKFSILMPPPNITGHLHVGHAMNMTTQDVFARYKKLKGFNVEWVPGTDHASIATEAKVVDKLAKEGRKKEDLTREEFEQGLFLCVEVGQHEAQLFAVLRHVVGFAFSKSRARLAYVVDFCSRKFRLF